jgi:hypothetical protein
VTLFTGVLAIVSFLQWIALQSTDKATHKLADAALKQAEAAGRQVIAMQGQLDEMKAAGKRTDALVNAAQTSAEAAKQSADAVANVERPYIFVLAKPTKVVPKDGPYDPSPTITYSLANMGRVPAVVRLLYAKCFLADKLGTPTYSRSKFKNAQSAIAAGQTLTELPVCEFESPLTVDDWGDLRSSKKSAVFMAVILYEGALDYTYVTAVAYQIEFFAGQSYAVGGTLYNYDESAPGRVTRGVQIPVPNIVP